MKHDAAAFSSMNGNLIGQRIRVTVPGGDEVCGVVESVEHFYAPQEIFDPETMLMIKSRIQIRVFGDPITIDNTDYEEIDIATVV